MKPAILIINICFCTVLAYTVNCCAQAAPSGIQYRQLWEQYKSTFIQDDGRLTDKLQKSISHSEGQGYGMLLSVLFNDRTTFSKLWQWTKNNLRGREDGFFAWSWGKRGNEQWGIIDYNNATDGDILIAYALLKASARWNDSGYKEEGLKIVQSIRKYLPIRADNRIYLLPAYYGFQKDDGAVLNPSYVIFSAYRIFSEVDDRDFWSRVHDDGVFLIEKSCFGKFKLPADWVTVNKTGISINEEKGPFFGYEAIRTLLYLSWESNPKFPKGVDEIFKFYEKSGYLPLMLDLSRNTISLDEAPAGFYAIYARAAEKKGLTVLSRQLFAEALKKAASEKDNYYSMSLLLLALQNAEQ